MKLAISTLSCPTWDLETVLDTMASAGISGIEFRGLGAEIDVTRLPTFTDDLPATVELLRARNASVPCLDTSVTLVAPDSARWLTMLDECVRYANLASGIGSPYLRVFGGAVPKQLSRAEACSLAQRHLRQLVKVCGPAATILVETHDAWSTSEQMLELLHEFDPADVGVLWDVEHPFRGGEDPAYTAQRLGRFIRHVHVKDSVPADGKNAPRFLGEGDLPLRDCFRALEDIGYTGWYSLEMEKRWKPEAPDPEISFPQFSRFMSAMLARTNQPRANQPRSNQG